MLWDDIQVSDKSTVYICDSDQIIAAADPDQIGKSIAVKSQRGYRVLKAKNDKTGIWNVYPFLFLRYSMTKEIKANICIGLGSMVALMLLSTVLPIYDEAGRWIWWDGRVYAMSEIENGNFDVQIPSVEHPANEVERIVAGFNEMSGQLKQPVEKVKQSTVDQKTQSCRLWRPRSIRIFCIIHWIPSTGRHWSTMILRSAIWWGRRRISCAIPSAIRGYR